MGDFEVIFLMNETENLDVPTSNHLYRYNLKQPFIFAPNAPRRHDIVIKYGSVINSIRFSEIPKM